MNGPLERDVIEHLQALVRNLPHSCPGCGAPSQTLDPKEAGFYSVTRSAVQDFLENVDSKVKEEDKVLDAVVKQADEETLKQLGLEPQQQEEEQSGPKPSPICDRCHNLIHHGQGVPIFHPSIQSVRDIIEESPYTTNHIYHVIDAADFPMSLIPSLQHDLKLSRLRTRNRRSKTKQYIKGRVAMVSFIITRADLLAPKKEQVDNLMPYLREVLRDALGEGGQNLRLGNVRCVSAKREWWTSKLKEDIWKRGGAGWMVGKVNVGKSKLFKTVFPKGGAQAFKADDGRRKEVELESSTEKQDEKEDVELLDESESGSLLPAAQPETPYPVMPVTSLLPGTTASPIRVPFGNGRGELIDLPGIARSSLADFVRPECEQELVMTSRVKPEQTVIKSGQTLLLGGGLLRIRPTTPGVWFMAYAFTKLVPHVTATAKARLMETNERAIAIPTIAKPGVKESLVLAGTFDLTTDITKQRAGPWGYKQKPEELPFIVYGADLVIEGVGWIELAAQVQKSRTIPSSGFPQFEVYSPEGKFVAIRPPMNAWLLGGSKTTVRRENKSRPRQSMRSLKQSAYGREEQARNHNYTKTPASGQYRSQQSTAA